MTARRDPTGWMWAQALDMLDEAERLHRRFFHLAASTHAAPVWQPPADVFEDEREIVVVVAMPGVPAGGVEVMHEAGALVVRGVRPVPLAGSRHAVRQLEIPYGAFERRIPLPAGRFEAAAPELVQGCLVLRLTKVRQIR
jgi:HSP20 family protein